MVEQRAAGRPLGISSPRVQDVAGLRAPGGARAGRGIPCHRGQRGAGLAAGHDRRLSSRARGTPGGSAALRANPGDLRAPGADRPRQRRLAARPLGLAQQDRRRAEWRRAIWPAALAATRRLAISERLAARTPATPSWQRDLSVSTTRSATCRGRRAICAAALRGYQDASRSETAGRSATPATPAGSATSRSAQQDRRRAGGAGRSGRRAEGLPATGSRSARSWPRATPATPAGSATSRSAQQDRRRAERRRAIWAAR